MQRNRKASRKAEHSGKWPEVIDFAEAKLRRTKAVAAQLEALITLFRTQAAAGDPCPLDVAEAILAEKQQKQA